MNNTSERTRVFAFPSPRSGVDGQQPAPRASRGRSRSDRHVSQQPVGASRPWAARIPRDRSSTHVVPFAVTNSARALGLCRNDPIGHGWSPLLCMPRPHPSYSPAKLPRCLPPPPPPPSSFPFFTPNPIPTPSPTPNGLGSAFNFLRSCFPLCVRARDVCTFLCASPLQCLLTAYRGKQGAVLPIYLCFLSIIFHPFFICARHVLTHAPFFAAAP